MQLAFIKPRYNHAHTDGIGSCVTQLGHRRSGVSLEFPKLCIVEHIYI